MDLMIIPRYEVYRGYIVFAFSVIIPPANFVVGILFSRCPSVRPSVRNVLFP